MWGDSSQNSLWSSGIEARRGGIITQRNPRPSFILASDSSELETRAPKHGDAIARQPIVCTTRSNKRIGIKGSVPVFPLKLTLPVFRWQGSVLCFTFFCLVNISWVFFKQLDACKDRMDYSVLSPWIPLVLSHLKFHSVNVALFVDLLQLQFCGNMFILAVPGLMAARFASLLGMYTTCM